LVWLLIVLLLAVLVLAAVFSPWRWPETAEAGPGDDELRHAATEVLDLGTARDDKYQEIRDAELDHETGKMSAADFRAVDAGLRAEAVEILKRLDRAQARLEKLQRADAGDGPVDVAWTRARRPESRAGAVEPADPVPREHE
jgi:hypothetical protein